MLINYLFHENNLKSQKTSNLKNKQIFSAIGLDLVDIYLTDQPFLSDVGIVNLHPSKGIHWVAYINENLFLESFVCSPPPKLSKFTTKRNGCCFYSEYKIQSLTNERGSFCDSYPLYVNYLTEILEIEFKNRVLKLYHQRFSLNKRHYGKSLLMIA